MQGKLVNIPRTIEDPLYRYKRSDLITKVEGKGNGIKTNLPNLPDIAKQLRTSPEYIMKFMGTDLGSQTIFQKKKNDITCIIKGEFAPDTINISLDKYIDKYVICKSCGLPEIFIKVQNKLLYSKCNSCGAENMLDNKHKVASYILKNPPKNQTEIKGGKDEGDANKQKKKRTKSKFKLDGEELKEFEELKNTISGITHETFDQELLDKVVAHTKNFFNTITKNGKNLKEEYVEEIYKRVRKMKFHDNVKDRYDYIFFQVVFDENFGNQIEKRAKFLKQIFIRARREDYYPYSVILNLQHNVYNLYKEKKHEKLISTFLLKFYQTNTIEKEFVDDWKDEELEDNFEDSFFYDAKNSKKFKEHAEDFLDYLDDDSDGSDSDSGSDSGDDEE